MPDFDECCDPAELLDLSGRKGLVVGIANDRSLAWPAALHFRQAGAELAVTYVDERTKPFVAPLAERLEAPILLPCNVNALHELDAVFDAITKRWGKLDFILHAVGSVPPADLHGRLTDCSAAGFTHAMQVSVHSLIRMAHLAEPLMKGGGSLITLSYLGGERVVESYNVMGPVKAALEATVRYLAHELGPSNIRVNAISAGPVRTLAGAGIADARFMFTYQQRNSPLRRTVTIDDVGKSALYLLSDMASGVTGEIHYVDSGYNTVSMPSIDTLKKLDQVSD